MYLICCTGDNKNFTNILKEFPEFKYGSQLPATIYSKLFFADQNWKNPRRKQYTTDIMLYRPYFATVLDLEKENQLSEVLDWANEISLFVEKIIIIPKVNGIILKLPKFINGREVVLGYSVPTKYAGTTVPIEEFQEWNVHLLGGDPFQQLFYYKRMTVISIDCNYHLMMANKSCQFFSIFPNYLCANPNWPTIKEVDGTNFEGNGRFEAFRRSCREIINFWRSHDIRISV